MTLEIARKVIQAEISALQEILDKLDDNFSRAVDSILRQNNRVITVGIGKAGIIARKTAATLSSTGTPSVFLHPSDALHGDLGVIRPGDTALIFSNSGESDEISRLLPCLRKNENWIIAITCSRRSTLGVQADIVLEMGRIHEACPLGLAPTSSTTAMLALGDALAVALMSRRGFTEKQYARFHPGGELGKRCFTVAEVMRGEDSVAFLPPSLSVAQALAAISRARAGAGLVVDENRQLLGIFTDGDLRRGLEEDSQLLSRPVGTVMNVSPRTVQESESAATALAMLRSGRIGEMPVINHAGRVTGMIDLKSMIAEGVN